MKTQVTVRESKGAAIAGYGDFPPRCSPALLLGDDLSLQRPDLAVQRRRPKPDELDEVAPLQRRGGGCEQGALTVGDVDSFFDERALDQALSGRSPPRVA